MTTGRNFDEVLRVIDSLQLTANYKVATPVNWKQGDDVIIAGSVSDEEAKKTYRRGGPRPSRISESFPNPEPDRRGRDRRPSEATMILKQFYLACLAHASYLVGDTATHTAAVVDPQRDVEQYLTFAREHDLRIAHVFLTHFHADFIAGHLELRERTGATNLGAAAKASAGSRLCNGDAVEFGRIRLSALETPGHTVESICILVYDLDTSATNPQAVLTGDTLFVGDVGRRTCGSRSAGRRRTGGMLYDSLRTRLLPLPDASLVYPAHGAGSLCGKSLGKETFSTMGSSGAPITRCSR